MRPPIPLPWPKQKSKVTFEFADTLPLPTTPTTPTTRARRTVARRLRWIWPLVVGLCLLMGFLNYESVLVRDKMSPLWGSAHRPPPHVPGPHHGEFGDSRHARVFERVTRGRVLVTGGGGNLGKHLVKRLLSTRTPVTVLDKLFHRDEEQQLYATIPRARQLLRVVLGDIRDPSALTDALTDDVAGVVHLAAVSRPDWCERNVVDCMDVNERGTERVLEAVTELGRRTGARPWFVLASSAAVYGNNNNNNNTSSPVSEESKASPTDAYAESKLRAENAVANHLGALQMGDKRSGALHAIVLRLATTVYGSAADHADRLVPGIVEPAIAHLPVQVVNGEQMVDLLHIDDATDAFLLAIRHLEQRAHAWRLLASRTSGEVYNIASADGAISVSDLTTKLLLLARSKSPIQRLPASPPPPITHLSTAKAATALGFRAQVSIDEGLVRLVRQYLSLTETFLLSELAECSSPAATAHNRHLDKLDGCQVHISVDVRGRLAALVPVSYERWAVEERLPPPQLQANVRRADDGGQKSWLLRFRDVNHPYAFFGYNPALGLPGASAVHAGVRWEDAGEAAVVDWEMEANEQDGTVKLVLPGTGRMLAPPPFFGGNFSWVDRREDVWPFRVTPVCCPSPAPWPFFAEDPVDQSIEHLRTSNLPQFLASTPRTICSRLARAHDKLRRDLATLSSDLLNPGARTKPKMGAASDWLHANLPACTNLCGHPTGCVDTGDCQCVRATCPGKERFPFAAAAHRSSVSYPPPSHENEKQNALLDAVAHSSWLSVLRPQAAAYMRARVPWPNVRIAPLTPDGAGWRGDDGADVDKLRWRDCFSADASMEHALRLLEREGEGKDVTFMPHYQHRGDWMWDQMWDSVKVSEGFDPHTLVVPFTYDYGTCRTFTWNMWQLRSQWRWGRDGRTRDIIAWTVMGDMNSPCYKPLQDIVIPPRTCASPDLYDAFGDMDKVIPSRQRKVLATFKGTFWGTGELTRRKVTCSRDRYHPRAPIPRLHNGHELGTIWSSWGDYPSYTAVLGDSIFCPVPEGTAGWAPRLEDALYAGCIPVFIGRAAQHPFFDTLDWSKISVTVDRADLQRLEEVLTGYSMEEVERLQANIMLVRDAFVYPLDGRHGEMMKKRSPLFFAMHETRMRLLTQYPVADVMDRPDWSDSLRR